MTWNISEKKWMSYSVALLSLFITYSNDFDQFLFDCINPSNLISTIK